MSGTIENAYANLKKKALVVGIYALKVPIFYNNQACVISMPRMIKFTLLRGSSQLTPADYPQTAPVSLRGA